MEKAVRMIGATPLFATRLWRFRRFPCARFQGACYMFSHSRITALSVAVLVGTGGVAPFAAFTESRMG